MTVTYSKLCLLINCVEGKTNVIKFASRRGKCTSQVYGPCSKFLADTLGYVSYGCCKGSAIVSSFSLLGRASLLGSYSEVRNSTKDNG